MIEKIINTIKNTEEFKNDTFKIYEESNTEISFYYATRAIIGEYIQKEWYIRKIIEKIIKDKNMTTRCEDVGFKNEKYYSIIKIEPLVLT